MAKSRIAVIGAGAIGGFVGASLARAGCDVTLVARGAHLQAMQQRGLGVRSPRGDFHVRPAATGDCATIGQVDYVIIALKAHQIAGMLPAILPLIGPATSVVAMQNGIPWWYFQQHGGAFEGLVLEAVDPGAILARAIDPHRVIGCVVYSSTAIAEPGIIQHVANNRFVLGHPDGRISAEIEALAAACIAGGLDAPIDTDLRRELWTKLMGNASFNPISALARATLIDLVSNALVESLVRELMGESIAVARRLGVELEGSIDARLDGARRVGAHKPSTLQDVEAGRPLEIDCMIGAVVELGERLGIPVPANKHVYALVKLLDASLARDAVQRARAASPELVTPV